MPWLPETCAYRRRAEGLPLPSWHHLLTGSRAAMVEAGACVAGKVVSERDAGDLENHIVDLGGERVIDWLRGSQEDPVIEVGGRALPLAIRRHARAKRLTMRLAPDGSEVRVTLPRWCRTSDALVFARARADWLERQLAAVPQSKPPAPGGELRYRGAGLLIAWHHAHRRTPRLEDQSLLVGGPEESLPARLQRWLESEARRLLADDLAFFCQRADRPAPQLRLSRARRRWGSCSDRAAIRINWRLVQAPDHVRRSVVAHEVAHLTHFDHSPAFHAELARLFDGDITAADRWLKDHGRELYAAFG